MQTRLNIQYTHPTDLMWGNLTEKNGEFTEKHRTQENHTEKKFEIQKKIESIFILYVVLQFSNLPKGNVQKKMRNMQKNRIFKII
jgi:hypothetical protein